jgi:hypothetical protein
MDYLPFDEVETPIDYVVVVGEDNQFLLASTLDSHPACGAWFVLGNTDALNESHKLTCPRCIAILEREGSRQYTRSYYNKRWGIKGND